MSKQRNEPIFALLGENRASLCLRVGLNATSAFRAEIDGETIAPVPLVDAALRAGETGVSLRGDEPLANAAEVTPQASDFMRVRFRALSAAVTRPSMEGLVVDFSAPGLLEAATALLYSVPVHKNHWAWDVEDFIGVVSQSEFDATGTDVEGVPGINVRLEVDKRLAPRIARGLLMKPSPINAVSVKVFFKFDYSHVHLVEQGMFWRMMGEEVDGSIVRLIVTEIVRFGELSFVGTGADIYNRRLPDDEVAEEVAVEGAAATGHRKTKAGMSASQEPKGETTVKLKQGMIAALGLQGDESTDFAETALQGALPGLVARAELGAQLLTSLRAEVAASALRVAALSHKGEGEPTLDVRDKLLIDKADAAELATLKKHYEEQATAGLSATCQKCGTKVTSLRSSVDTNAPEQEADLSADDDYAITLI